MSLTPSSRGRSTHPIFLLLVDARAAHPDRPSTRPCRAIREQTRAESEERTAQNAQKRAAAGVVRDMIRVRAAELARVHCAEERDERAGLSECGKLTFERDSLGWCTSSLGRTRR